MDHYRSYWGLAIHILSGSLKEADHDIAKHLRETVYGLVREKSGLLFADYGDDADRWLAWLEANDTTNPEEIRRRHDSEWERMSEDERETINKLMGIG